MRVFLSSTYEDLVGHRASVELSLSMSGVPYNAMEHFGSTPSPPLKTCLDAVKDSNVFVGVLGVRYGSSPGKAALSYTEREYRTARAVGMPILIFLIDMRNAAVPPHLVSGESAERQVRLVEFKKRVQRLHTVTFFTTPEDLARVVLASLIRQFGVT